jgi:hypothetical protein
MLDNDYWLAVHDFLGKKSAQNQYNLASSFIPFFWKTHFNIILPPSPRHSFTFTGLTFTSILILSLRAAHSAHVLFDLTLRTWTKLIHQKSCPVLLERVLWKTCEYGSSLIGAVDNTVLQRLTAETRIRGRSPSHLGKNCSVRYETR